MNDHRDHGAEEEGRGPLVNIAWGSASGMGLNVIGMAEGHIPAVAEVDLQVPVEGGFRPTVLSATFDSWGVGGYRN